MGGLLACLSTVPAVAGGQSPRLLIPFEIEDQHRRLHRQADYLDRVVLVLGSDRGGSRFSAGWRRAITQAVGGEPRFDKLSVLSLADLRGVPFFVRGSVRKRFPRAPDNRVLLDWKGLFPVTYAFEPDACNLLVFAADGALVIQAHGREVDPETLAAVVAAIREQLERQAR